MSYTELEAQRDDAKDLIRTGLDVYLRQLRRRHTKRLEEKVLPQIREDGEDTQALVEAALFEATNGRVGRQRAIEADADGDS